MKRLQTTWSSALQWEEDDTPRQVQFFNATGRSLLIWRQQSVSLFHAAQYLVEEKSGLRDQDRREENAPSALMLGGFALEALFKMVVIADHNAAHGLSLASRQARDFLPKTHDLVQLAKKARLRTNAGDRKVLLKLSEYSIWAGRYPIPLQADSFENSAFGRLVMRRPGEKSQLSIVTEDFVPLYTKLYPLARRRAFGPTRKNRSGRD